jgi:hypothetical protein
MRVVVLSIGPHLFSMLLFALINYRLQLCILGILIKINLFATDGLVSLSFQVARAFL